MLVDASFHRIEKLDNIIGQQPSAAIQRLFTGSEEAIDLEREQGIRESAEELADLNQYYVFVLPLASTKPEAERFLGAILQLEVVETAYFEAIPLLPGIDIAPPTPNYRPSQTYFTAAPVGVDAAYAQTQAGGDGSSIRIIDIEYGWRLSHEDFKAPTTFYSSDPSDPVLNATNGGIDFEHGTAVLGIVVAESNGFGVTGIAPGAQYSTVATSGGSNIANAVNRAARFLRSGDAILIEQQIAGPASGLSCPCNCSQFELIPPEWEQATFDAIRSATARGIVVVQTAGNGGMNLDSSLYNIGFYDNSVVPPLFKLGNVFSKTVRDSGAVMVGASVSWQRVGACWTNYGSRIDSHSWGDSIWTAGYEALFTTDPNQYYTSGFGGTSGAGAIVAGAVVATQGYMLQRYGLTLAPLELRKLLTTKGTPQIPGGKLIGSQPNLAAAFSSTCSRSWVTFPIPGFFGPLLCN
jgi:hypothetical protein